MCVHASGEERGHSRSQHEQQDDDDEDERAAIEGDGLGQHRHNLGTGLSPGRGNGRYRPSIRTLLELPGWDRLTDGATPYALAVNLPYALAFAFVAGEVAWLARRPGPVRRAVLVSAATATTMAVGAFFVGMAYTAALRWLWGLVATARLEPLAEFWAAYPVLGAVFAFIAWDFSGWVYHVIGHRTRVGWAAHQVHHTGESYDATLGLRQTWAPFHGLLHHPLLALLGFDLRVIIVCAAASNCWQVMEHTSLPIRFPRWFEAVVMTPAAHRHHHGRDGGLVNMGPFLTCWDRIAGTWVGPEVPAPTTYGPAVRASANPLKVELAGWVALARARSRSRHLQRQVAVNPSALATRL